MPQSSADNDFSLSLLDYTLGHDAHAVAIDNLDRRRMVMVGAGAIGNGALWTLQRMPGLRGTIELVDHETVSLSNLQRYVLALQTSINQPKVDLAQQLFKGKPLSIIPHHLAWQDYIAARSDWQIENIAVCVDSAEDRIAVQGALPKKLFNAWTQKENLGVSSHLDFNGTPCLCCLYQPKEVKKSRAQEIANSLNLATQESTIIRPYLANNRPVDERLLQLIVDANNLQSSEALAKFIGQPLEVFYSEAVCGGVLMGLGATGGTIGYKSALPSASVRFNLIRAMTEYIKFRS